ncbi:MAG: hypothetical protein ACKPCI_01715, partial [Dolichospermum sp.]
LVVILVRIIVALFGTVTLIVCFPLEFVFFVLWITILAISGKSRKETKSVAWEFPISLRKISDIWIWVFAD